jgi:chemotaxis protein MotB
MAKRIQEEDSGDDNQGANIWLTIYSDMTTNLTLFFLILYAFTRLGATQQQSLYTALRKMSGSRAVVTAAPPSAQQQTDELSKKLSAYGHVEMNEERIKITLPSPVLFDLGKAELKPEAKIILRAIADNIKNISNPVIIEGHTDNIPITGGYFSSNWELSAARANSVIRYYIDEEKMPPERFSALGYGEYHPIAPNDTETNRAKNRRIEIIIVRK